MSKHNVSICHKAYLLNLIVKHLVVCLFMWANKNLINFLNNAWLIPCISFCNGFWTRYNNMTIVLWLKWSPLHTHSPEKHIYCFLDKANEYRSCVSANMLLQVHCQSLLYEPIQFGRKRIRHCQFPLSHCKCQPGKVWTSSYAKHQIFSNRPTEHTRGKC